jgi:transposase, IS5 family
MPVTSERKSRAKRGRKFWIAAKRSVVKSIDGPALREITEQLEQCQGLDPRDGGASVPRAQAAVRLREGATRASRRMGTQVTTLFALVTLSMARRTLMQTT